MISRDRDKLIFYWGREIPRYVGKHKARQNIPARRNFLQINTLWLHSDGDLHSSEPIWQDLSAVAHRPDCHVGVVGKGAIMANCQFRRPAATLFRLLNKVCCNLTERLNRLLEIVNAHQYKREPSDGRPPLTPPFLPQYSRLQTVSGRS